MGPSELLPPPKAFLRNLLRQDEESSMEQHSLGTRAGSYLWVAEIGPTSPLSWSMTQESLGFHRISSGKEWPQDPWEMPRGRAAGRNTLGYNP